jgi:hypothetical protein
MVLVRNPHEGQRVARELSDSALIVIKGPGFNAILVASAVVTALLTIPNYGIWFSAIALTMGASAYGEIIRRASPGPTDEPALSQSRTLLPKTIAKFLVCALMAVGTVVPLWMLNAGFHQSPRWDVVSRSVAALAWIVLPPLMLVLYGRTEQDTPLGFRSCIKSLVKHPFAALLALAVVPITLVVLEFCVALTIYLGGNLPFFALEFMPMPLLGERNEGPVMYNGIPFYHMVDYRSYPVSVFHQGYLDGLRHGYTFVGAIPASMSLSNRAGMNASIAIGLIGPSYYIIRLIFSLAIVTSLLAAFAVQARWLGSIPALERRKSA